LILSVIHPFYPGGGSYGDLAGAQVPDQMPDNGGNAIYENADPSFIWMETVRLIELSIRRDTLEKKRIKRHATVPREIRINLIERDAVFFTPIRRRPHAGQQQLGSARLYFGDDGIEIGANDVGMDSAQRVVRAQFEDHEVGFLGQRPVHSGEAALRGVARDSRIEDLYRFALCPQTRFELGREGGPWRNPEPGGETVAQNKDHHGARSGGGFSGEKTRHHAEPHANWESAASEQPRTANRTTLRKLLNIGRVSYCRYCRPRASGGPGGDPGSWPWMPAFSGMTRKSHFAAAPNVPMILCAINS
jgi:hypothetical protein